MMQYRLNMDGVCVRCVFAAIALPVLSLCGAASAAPTAISASLSPGEIPWHRTATYTLRIEAPAEDEIAFPDIPSANPDLMIKKAELRATRTDGSQIVEQDYTLDAVRPGAYVLPGQRVDTLSVPPMVLSVRDLTQEEIAAAAQFEGLPPLEAVAPEAPTPAWLIAAIALGVAALGFAAGWLALRRRKGAPPPPPEPAWVVAQRRLTELASRQLAQQGRYEAYYVDLSAILRYYIEDRFFIRAPEQTTPEFMESAANSGRLTEAQQEALAQLMRHFDRVKFARYEPTMAEMEESFRVVVTFVRETVPVTQQETGAAA
jgi:hypothetical protein